MKKTPKITVEAIVQAPMEIVWQAWNSPEDIMQWNSASDDWHTTKSIVDLREGGNYLSRMEAKDGSMGFDFEGTYTKIEKHHVIESRFGDRTLVVEFTPHQGGTTVTETFDAEEMHSVEMQEQGWQAILNRFKAHVEFKHAHES